MGLTAGTRRTVLCATVAAAIAGATTAWAVIPAEGTINGCYDAKGALRVVDAGVRGGERCARGETPLAWNRMGPRGLPGDTGPTGATGPSGPDPRFFATRVKGQQKEPGEGAQDCYLGEVRLFAGTGAPNGMLPAEGQTLPIAGNTALFSAIGPTYGGNGKSHFRLPDLHGLGPAGTNYAICVVGRFPG